MNDIQKHLMALVDELCKACNENGIPFVLYGRTAGCAIKNGRFVTGAYPFQIMMEAGRFPSLKEAVQKKNYDSRAFEAKDNNPELPASIVRYVDTATCLFDRKEAAPYRINGVAVTIYLVEPEKTGFLGLFRKNPAKKYLLKMGDNTMIQLPGDSLLQRKMITFEGRQLPVPEKEEPFFRSIYGENWKEEYAVEQQSINSSFVIWDAECSYKDYLKEFESESIDIYKTISQIRDLERFKAGKLAELKEASQYYWEAACRSVDRIVLLREYKDKREALRKAAVDNDIVQLKELLGPYLERTEYYKQFGLGFYIDQELFDFAKKAWAADGKEEQSQIMRMVPEEFLKDDLAERLGEYA